MVSDTHDMHKTKATMFLLAPLLLAGLGACAAGSAGSGHATGLVVDTHGNPVAGAKILLDNTVFYASYIHGSSKADGRYRIKLHPGAWRAQASIKKDYNGRTYTLELHPHDNDGFSEEGAVRDFSWKLEGRTPDNEYGYYGGFIQLTTDLDFHEDLSDIEITLTPDGPLIDGSQGKTLQLRLRDHYWVDNYQIEDIPIGRYTVTATLHGDAGARALGIQDWYTRDAFAQAFRLDFNPNPGRGPKNSASIVIGY